LHSSSGATGKGQRALVLAKQPTLREVAIVLSDENLDAVIVHNEHGTSCFGSEGDAARAILEGIDPDHDRPETS
jgi:hypothetical protein